MKPDTHQPEGVANRCLPAFIVLCFLGTACEETVRNWEVCNYMPCMEGYSCIQHRCVKGDPANYDPATRFPGWEGDAGLDVGVGGDGSSVEVEVDDGGRPVDGAVADRPASDGRGALDAPEGCGGDKDCAAGAPVCRERRCSKCTGDGDCVGRPGMACDVGSGACVECTDAAKHCSSPGKPFCVSNACVGCQAAGAGTCKGATPACDSASGRCVQCTDSAAHCTADAAKAFCVANVCVGCQTAGAGACKGSEAVCESGSGKCVQCTDPGLHCKAEPGKAFCVAGRCAGCQAAGAGACKDPTPTCNATSGQCVECLTHGDCRATGKPICDTSTNRCVPCSSDAQCRSKGEGPGVCMSHDDGRCASDAETVYVENKPGCSMGGAGGGTAAAPFCPKQVQDAIDAANMSSSKRLVVIRGTVPGWSANSSRPEQLAIVGQNGALVAGGSGSAISLSGGDFYLRGLTISLSAETGVIVEAGATLRMNRCVVKGNMKGGLIVKAGAGFDVANSVFDSNEGGFAQGTGAFGGVALGAARDGGPARLRNNTIINNKAQGVVCERSTQPVMGLLLYQNAGGDVVNCEVRSSRQTSDGNPKLTSDYHLNADSPCRDTGDMPDFPADDLDGDSRPQGARSDCGADEYRAGP